MEQPARLLGDRVRDLRVRVPERSDRKPTETTNLDGYGNAPLSWSRVHDILAAGPSGPDTPFFLGTVRPDGRRPDQLRRIRFQEPMTVSTLSGHRRVPPYGMAGGSPGSLGANRVERRDGTVVHLGGCDSVEVQPGDVLVIETPGGGGYGANGRGGSAAQDQG